MHLKHWSGRRSNSTTRADDHPTRTLPAAWILSAASSGHRTQADPKPFRASLTAPTLTDPRSHPPKFAIATSRSSGVAESSRSDTRSSPVRTGRETRIPPSPEKTSFNLWARASALAELPSPGISIINPPVMALRTRVSLISKSARETFSLALRRASAYETAPSLTAPQVIVTAAAFGALCRLAALCCRGCCCR